MRDISLLSPINGQLANNRLKEDLKAVNLEIQGDQLVEINLNHPISPVISANEDDQPVEVINQPLDSAADQLVAEPLNTDQPPNSPTEDDNWYNTFIEQLRNYAEEAYISIPGDPIPEPLTYKEILESPYRDNWLKALGIEFNKLVKQDTWTLTELPPGRKAISGRWVTKIKTLEGGLPIYKARWVAKGFQQQFGVDFTETYANTVDPISYRLILAIAAYKDWEIDQWDVVSAYPNANIDEEVYIRQPIGFEDGTTRVCKLNKALYGLKQAARQWEWHLKAKLKDLGLEPLNIDRSVYINKDGPIILIAYVDDILAISPSRDIIANIYVG